MLYSGVLAASLHRSRNRWLVEGIFERYWTKPVKKKGQPEFLNNPPKESMQKVGQCRITIEPHVFEATLFAVREWQAPINVGLPLLPGAKQFGLPRQHSTGLVSNYPYPPLSSFQAPPLQSRMTYAATGPSFHIQGPPPSPSPKPILPPAQHAFMQTPAPSDTMIGSLAPQSKSKPAQDPVIQMLAQRASTNAALKVLMKVVASGNATGDQLKIFQSHIDDLTAIVRHQKHLSSLSAAPPQMGNIESLVPPQWSNGITAGNGASNTYSLPQTTGMASASKSYVYPLGVQSTSAFPASETAFMKPKTTVAPKSGATVMAIEFSSGSGDRFLFPKYSVLEYLPGNRQVICSFLVVRKGISREGPKYNSNMSYHQPITIRLAAEYPRVLETLSKAVAPYDEVRVEMEQIMKTTTRAERVHLAIQLPTDAKNGNIRSTTVATASDGVSTALLEGRNYSRLSLARQSPSSSTEVKISRVSKNKQDDWDEHCQYCFIAVPAAQSKIDGVTVCQSCSALRKASSSMTVVAALAAAKHLELPMRHPSGRRALMLSREIC